MKRFRGIISILCKVDKPWIFKAHLGQVSLYTYSTFSLNMFNIFVKHEHYIFKMLKLHTINVEIHTKNCRNREFKMLKLLPASSFSSWCGRPTTEGKGGVAVVGARGVVTVGGWEAACPTSETATGSARERSGKAARPAAQWRAMGRRQAQTTPTCRNVGRWQAAQRHNGTMHALSRQCMWRDKACPTGLPCQRGGYMADLSRHRHWRGRLDFGISGRVAR